MMTHDPLQIALEIREQLASEKRRLAFLLGAGTSMAVGMPGITSLTEKVSEQLKEPFKTQYKNIRKELPKNSNVENVLDRVRIYRELIGDSEEKEYCSLKGASAAKNLDFEICQAICDIVREKPPKGIKPHLIFSQWIRLLHCNRDWPVEIFTTNYDLLIEQAMEEYGVPFFDGFIGSVTPFFMPESVESEVGKSNGLDYPPRTWTRLWKIHGSINWYVKKNSEENSERITRLSVLMNQPGEELVIFPSREKYAQSRKLPYIAFQDRLRKFLSLGESLFIILGYSFSDEHLNDIIFQGLRSNPRLTVLVFLHSSFSDNFAKFGQEHRNLTIYGPDKACIGGIIAEWSKPIKKRKENENWPFWNEEDGRFTLGDFTSFASFLELFIGFKKQLMDFEIDDTTPSNPKIQIQENAKHEN